MAGNVQINTRLLSLSWQLVNKKLLAVSSVIARTSRHHEGPCLLFLFHRCNEVSLLSKGLVRPRILSFLTRRSAVLTGFCHLGPGALLHYPLCSRREHISGIL